MRRDDHLTEFDGSAGHGDYEAPGLSPSEQ
jgi:hypothetical protein